MIYWIGVMGVLGLLLPVIAEVKLGRLTHAARHPGKSTHALVRTMVTKFTACYKLKIGVNNVDNFVDKHTNTHKICGLYVSTWDKLCGQPWKVLLITGVVEGVYRGIFSGGQIRELSTMWISFAAAGVLIIYNGFFNRQGKLRAFSDSMKDYLENTLRTKLEQEFSVPQQAEGLRRAHLAAADKRSYTELASQEAAAGQLERRMEKWRQKNAVKSTAKKEKPVSTAGMPLDMEQEIIDEILQEYLS